MSIASLWYFGNLRAYLRIETLQQHQEFICTTINHYPISSALLYILTFYVLTISALPTTLAMITIGGFLFGWQLGSSYALIAMLMSSMTVFIASQKMFGVYFQRKYHHELKKFNQLMDHYGFYYLLFIRTIPLIPFFIINICAGLTQIDKKTFIITTAIGALPTVLICSYLGSQCASLVVNL
jgi:uncharacterized membrane protein YdjX (TVP38/TMEM64 family)